MKFQTKQKKIRNQGVRGWNNYLNISQELKKSMLVQILIDTKIEKVEYNWWCNFLAIFYRVQLLSSCRLLVALNQKIGYVLKHYPT
jgi:hypothetical protein